MWAETIATTALDLLYIGTIAGIIFHEWILPRHRTTKARLRVEDDQQTAPDYAFRGQRRAFPGPRVLSGVRAGRGPLSEEETLKCPRGYLPRIPKS